MHIKRKAVKMLKAPKDKDAKSKAMKYGYDKEYASNVSGARAIKKSGKKPVAKDTNKTRRAMVKPTKRSAYAS